MRGLRIAWFGERPVLGAYVAALALLAVASFAVTWSAFGVRPLDGRWLELGILLAVLCWSEAKPIAVVRAGVADNVVASTTIAFTIFLAFGAVPAMAAQALASVIADAQSRKPIVKVVFNAAQYWVAWGAAAFAFGVVQADGPGHVERMLTSRWYLAVAAAGLTYLIVNNALVGVAIGLSQATRVLRSIRSTLMSEWRSDILLLALTPIVVIVLEQSIAAVPLLLLPLFAVYRSVTISAEKEHLALHDPLTSLPNRFNFTSVLASRLEAGDAHHNTTVMLFDLDHFKEINDTLGHQAGDELLKMIGPRITGVLPEGSVVARFGGDEYAVLVPSVDDPCAALGIARSIASELETPFRLEGFNIEVKGSLGVAIHPVDGATGDELIKSADIAMYVAKSRGTVVERYDADLDTHSTRRLEMVGEMRTAIAEGSLDLYYQPKLGLLDRRVTGVEALVRWDHPRLGDIPPSEFVPLAEHTGLIRPLTSLVLTEAAVQISRWTAAGIELVVAVNLSARSLHDGTIVDEVARILAEHGVPPQLLRLEITEGSIMADPARAMTVLERLAAMGVRLSIDDFGTGYSSLAYLKDLPVDEIKIDQSFVTNLLESEGDRVIVSAIIDLGVNLGLTSVAEGVESSSALTWLRGAGCNQAQGYHVARPMPAAALDEWLRSFDTTAPSDDGQPAQGDVPLPMRSGSTGTLC